MTPVDAFTLASSFAREYLQAHPNENVQGLQIQVRNYLQTQKKNGVKISDKNIAQVNAQIKEIYTTASEQVAANAKVKITPQAQEAVKTLNSSVAVGNYDRTYRSNAAESGHYYDKIQNMNRTARQRVARQNGRDARSAFASPEYIEFLRKNHPEMLAEIESNSFQKQIVKDSSETYVSSKQRENNKKQQEIASQQEHADRRASNANGKRAKNQKYFDNLDQKEIEIKRKVRMYNKKLDGRVSVHVSNQKNDVLKEMREFYTKQAEEAAKNAANTVSNTAESAAKNASKAGKTGLIAAGVAVVAGALAYLGLSGDKKAGENKINMAA